MSTSATSKAAVGESSDNRRAAVRIAHLAEAGPNSPTTAQMVHHQPRTATAEAMVDDRILTMDNAVAVPNALRWAGRRTMFDVLCRQQKQQPGEEVNEPEAVANAPPSLPPQLQRLHELPDTDFDGRSVVVRQCLHPSNAMATPTPPSAEPQPSPLEQKVGEGGVDLRRRLKHLLPSFRAREKEEAKAEAAQRWAAQSALVAATIADFSDDDDQPPPSHPLPPTGTGTMTRSSGPITMEGLLMDEMERAPLQRSRDPPPHAPARRSIQNVWEEMEAAACSAPHPPSPPPPAPMTDSRGRGRVRVDELEHLTWSSNTAETGPTSKARAQHVLSLRQQWDDLRRHYEDGSEEAPPLLQQTFRHAVMARSMSLASLAVRPVDGSSRSGGWGSGGGGPPSLRPSQSEPWWLCLMPGNLGGCIDGPTRASMNLHAPAHAKLRRQLADNPVSMRMLEYLRQSYERWPIQAYPLWSVARTACGAREVGCEDANVQLFAEPVATLEGCGIDLQLQVVTVESAFSVARIAVNIVWASSAIRDELDCEGEAWSPDVEHRRWCLLMPETVVAAVPIRVDHHVYLSKPCFIFPGRRLILSSYNVTSDALIDAQWKAFEEAAQNGRESELQAERLANRSAVIAPSYSSLLEQSTIRSRMISHVPESSHLSQRTPFKGYDPLAAGGALAGEDMASEATPAVVAEGGNDGIVAQDGDGPCEEDAVDPIGHGFPRGPGAEWYLAVEVIQELLHDSDVADRDSHRHSLEARFGAGADPQSSLQGGDYSIWLPVEVDGDEDGASHPPMPGVGDGSVLPPGRMLPLQEDLHLCD